MCTPIAIGTVAQCQIPDPQTWCDVNCFAAFSQQMNTTNGRVGFSPAGQQAAQASITQLLQTYAAQQPFTDANPPPFQQTLLELCLDPAVPGGCDPFLSQYCAGKTEAELQESRIDAQLCGCYVPPPPGVPDGCQGTCNQVGVVRKAAPDGSLLRCPGTVCVINDVNVNQINNSTQGQVNIFNVCPGCVAGQCTCVVESANVSSLAGSVGLTTNVANFCGPGSTYRQVSPDGTVTLLSADQITGQILSNPANPARYPWPLLLVAALVLVAVASACLLLRFLKPRP